MAALDDAERRIGRPLPADLRALYLIADGDGIGYRHRYMIENFGWLSLESLVAEYTDRCEWEDRPWFGWDLEWDAVVFDTAPPTLSAVAAATPTGLDPIRHGRGRQLPRRRHGPGQGRATGPGHRHRPRLRRRPRVRRRLHHLPAPTAPGTAGAGSTRSTTNTSPCACLPPTPAPGRSSAAPSPTRSRPPVRPSTSTTSTTSST
ncbi:hypothetical protein ACGFZR_06365 [Streptomyces sp. NPDC048241]|uniref:hypothetical protein n=1 Tax=Streptomyces sp. NPDC048241 TaxID=3365521 RepID=UPI003718EC39